MQTLLRIIILFGLIGCAEQSPIFENDKLKIDLSNRTTSASLLPYIEQYERLTGTKVTIPVRYITGNEELKTTVIGVCLHSRQSLVVIDTSVTRPEQIRWVVYHELLHCLKGLGHSDDPKSLMYGFINTQALNFLNYNEQEAMNYALGGN